MFKKIDHIVITTPNIEDCLSFYERLGFTSSQAGGRYELFSGDFKINVHVIDHELKPHAKHVQPGSGDLCFELNVSLDEFSSYLDSKGIAVEIRNVARHGVKGEMNSIYLRDPDGNLLEFCNYT